MCRHILQVTFAFLQRCLQGILSFFLYLGTLLRSPLKDSRSDSDIDDDFKESVCLPAHVNHYHRMTSKVKRNKRPGARLSGGEAKVLNKGSPQKLPQGSTKAVEDSDRSVTSPSFVVQTEKDLSVSEKVSSSVTRAGPEAICNTKSSSQNSGTEESCVTEEEDAAARTEPIQAASEGVPATPLESEFQAVEDDKEEQNLPSEAQDPVTKKLSLCSEDIPSGREADEVDHQLTSDREDVPAPFDRSDTSSGSEDRNAGNKSCNPIYSIAMAKAETVEKPSNGTSNQKSSKTPKNPGNQSCSSSKGPASTGAYSKRRDKTRETASYNNSSSWGSSSFSATGNSVLSYFTSRDSSAWEDSGFGRGKGFQWNNNSCYIDSTLFSMFYATRDFDDALLNPGMGNAPKTKHSNRVLQQLKATINKLRGDGYCPSQFVSGLRRILAEKNPRMLGLMLDVEELLLTLLGNKGLDLQPFIKYSVGSTNFFHSIFFVSREREESLHVQDMLERSMGFQNLKFAELPKPALFIKMPRAAGELLHCDRVVPDFCINLSLLVDEKCDPNQETCHVLGAVICLRSHHYTAYVRDIETDQWVYFNDMGPIVRETKVSEQSWELGNDAHFCIYHPLKC